MEEEINFKETGEPPGKSEKNTDFSNTREIDSLHPSLVRELQSIVRGTLQAEILTVNSRADLFRQKFHPNVSRGQWSDWKWQVKNRLTEVEQFEKILNLSGDERRALIEKGAQLPVGITPYYASLLDPHNPKQALRKCVLPTPWEWNISPEEMTDPLGEDHDSPVPGLVHRYPDRVLFLVTNFCSVNCRYCTRSRAVGNDNSCHFGPGRWEAALKYIQNTPSIRDVLLSGGDPLTMSDERLEWLLTRLRKIKHVEFIRIGSKVPAVLPQRITESLTAMLKRFHPLWMSLHFTHPDELTPETSRACQRLADAGIPLGSQTVLLKGVNDNLDTMRKLMHGLLKIRVRPYYLYQCDLIPGSSHFRTPVENGLEIIRGLRGHTTGYAVPQFVIDAPGGGGKIPLLPDYREGRHGDYLELRNYRGKTYRYYDPAENIHGEGEQL